MKEESFPLCPICGSEAEYFYRRNGEIIGCSDCTDRVYYVTIKEENDYAVSENEAYTARKRRREEGII